jgi:protease-4
LALLPLWLLARRLSRPSRPWVELHLHSRVIELRVADPLWRRLVPAARTLRATSLQELRKLCDAIARDPHVEGLLVHVPPLETGWAVCASLRQMLLALRAAGKQVVCYVPEGGGNRELYVALAGDRIVAGPLTAFSPLGLASRPLYVKHALDRLGIEVQVQACGEYKSAAEPAARESMSEPARRQTEALLASLHGELQEALCARGGITPEHANEALASGLLSAQRAKALGVIDAIAYEDELPAFLAIAPGKGRAFTPAPRYLRYHQAKLWRPIRAQPYIAVIPVRGAIAVDATGLMQGGATLRRVVGALRAAASDSAARAVVLYVNSPGGSALASELIHREVQRLARKKPLVAYFGDVAASGGYYVATPARRIVAQPVSVTGSIGVISMKVAVTGLLQRVGIKAEAVQTTPHADMFSPVRPMTDDEAQMLQSHAQELYQRFLQVVAEGRGRSLDEIDTLARGRVWSGRDAQKHGLVDVLGGFDRALDEARALLPELSPEQRAKLLPRVRVAEQGEPPPPERSAAQAVEGLLALLPWLPKSAAQGLCLARREPALYYAADLPDSG